MVKTNSRKKAQPSSGSRRTMAGKLQENADLAQEEH